jgi:5,10-methylene-tetrahydrofolate dehydrogenase/methenyl tetrahydrofolate cyclohydrolase
MASAMLAALGTRALVRTSSSCSPLLSVQARASLVQAWPFSQKKNEAEDATKNSSSKIATEGENQPKAAPVSQRRYTTSTLDNVASPSTFVANVLDGKKVAQQWLSEIAQDVSHVKKHLHRPPGLAVVLVGNRADSVLYVNKKRQAAKQVGIDFQIKQLPEKVSQERLLEHLDEIFSDDHVDGVIVQLPLPRHIDEEAVLEHIDPHKDIDGFHPLNVGRLAMRGVHPVFVPCTPLGSVELLKRYGIDLLGKRVVILGNSNTVGTPLSVLLRDEGASAVTVCHCTSIDFANQRQHYSRLEDDRIRAFADACLPPLQDGGGSSGGGKRHLPASCIGQIPEICRTADVLFVAIGYPELVKKDWVKEGCIVVDIGINAKAKSGRNINQVAKEMLGHRKRGRCQTAEVEICGDVDFEEVGEVASAITPVPGGSGPMTIAALLANCTLSATRVIETGGKRGGTTKRSKK